MEHLARVVYVCDFNLSIYRLISYHIHIKAPYQLHCGFLVLRGICERSVVSPALSRRRGKWHVIETAIQRLSNYRQCEDLVALSSTCRSGCSAGHPMCPALARRDRYQMLGDPVERE